MDKKIWYVLNALGVLALIAALVLGNEVYQLLKPQPISEEVREVNRLLEERRKNPPLPSMIQERKQEVDDIAVKKVIQNYIKNFLRNSKYTFGNMTKDEYIEAIANAVIRYTSSSEDAFWFIGMIQTESSFRITARPGKRSNSSARGLIQVIWRYHGKYLEKNGILREDLDSNIDKSIHAGILIFNQYLKYKSAKGDKLIALRYYRSKSASEEEQQAYSRSVRSVVAKLSETFKKELKSA